MDVFTSTKTENYDTIDELEARLGASFRELRIRDQLDQRALAAKANVGLSALKNLEAGKGTTLKTLLKVLKALDRVDWLDALAPTVSVSPLQMLRATQPRQRVYAPRRKRDGAAG